MSDTRQELCRVGSREATAIKTWSFTFYRVCLIFKPNHYVYYAFVGSFLSAKTDDLVDMSFGYDFRTLVSVLT